MKILVTHVLFRPIKAFETDTMLGIRAVAFQRVEQSWAITVPCHTASHAEYGTSAV